MEVRINNKIKSHVDDIIQEVTSYIDKTRIDDSNKHNIVNIIANYPLLNVSVNDLQKKRRCKNSIPLYLRCNACRANGEQCSRRKRDNFEYCGTHEKNRPYGEINNGESVTNYKKVEVWAQDINGIIYYIDNSGNVYKTQDIISNKMNPSVIYRYQCISGIYTILDI